MIELSGARTPNNTWPGKLHLSISVPDWLTTALRSVFSFTAPKFKLYTTPKIELYTAPKVELYTAPKIELYTAPNVELYTAPKIELYTAPKIELFTAPKIELYYAASQPTGHGQDQLQGEVRYAFSEHPRAEYGLRKLHLNLLAVSWPSH